MRSLRLRRSVGYSFSTGANELICLGVIRHLIYFLHVHVLNLTQFNFIATASQLRHLVNDPAAWGLPGGVPSLLLVLCMRFRWSIIAGVHLLSQVAGA